MHHNSILSAEFCRGLAFCCGVPPSSTEVARDQCDWNPNWLIKCRVCKKAAFHSSFELCSVAWNKVKKREDINEFAAIKLPFSEKLWQELFLISWAEKNSNGS